MKYHMCMKVLSLLRYFKPTYKEKYKRLGVKNIGVLFWVSALTHFLFLASYWKQLFFLFSTKIIKKLVSKLLYVITEFKQRR